MLNKNLTRFVQCLSRLPKIELGYQGPFATAAMEAALFAGNSTKNVYSTQFS